MASSAVQRQARHHMPVAGHGPQQHPVRALDGARHGVHRSLVADAGPADSAQNHPCRDEGLGSRLTMGQHPGYTLRDVFHVLFKHKWIILAFFSTTFLAGTAFAIASNVTLYQATAQILVSPGREHLSDFTVSASAAVPPRLSFDLDEQ